MSPGLELLRILSDGRFHSGEALGRRLGVGRAAVWKHLQALREAGIRMDSVTGRGYRLAEPVELLCADTIAAALAPGARNRLGRIEIHPEIDSTNSELLRRAATLPTGTVCLAEAQRAGRGRQGRRWVSSCARNLALSILWRFSRGPDALGGLALAVGLAVLRAVHDLGARDAGVKWPNDILWRDAKLAGTLIELSGESGGASSVVIGVGINVRMPAHADDGSIDQPWVDLATASGDPAVSRNALAAAVLSRLVEALGRFERDGLAAFRDEWRACDVLHGRTITVQDPATGAAVTGMARGIDAAGALLVELDGATRRFFSGDVSVRARAPLEARPGPEAAPATPIAAPPS